MTSSAPVSDANLLIRGGYVLTMDPAGDIPGGDVHLRNGVIEQIGTNLDVPEAEVIDAVGQDRGARPGGHALAHVEHAAARDVGRAADPGRPGRERLLRHLRRGRQALPAR